METEQKFKSISEIVSDDIFINYVDKNFNDIVKKRKKRPSPKQGYHYKRDWYDRMWDNGQLSSYFFLTNIESIWLKKSNLPSETRNVIQIVCSKALQETLKFYEE